MPIICLKCGRKHPPGMLLDGAGRGFSFGRHRDCGGLYYSVPEWCVVVLDEKDEIRIGRHRILLDLDDVLSKSEASFESDSELFWMIDEAVTELEAGSAVWIEGES